MDGNKVAENEGPGQPFVIDFVLEGIGYDGHTDRDALVAAAAVGHRGKRAARHTRVGRGSGHSHSEAQEIIAEYLQLVLTYGFAHLEAIVSLQAFISKGKVERTVLEDESDVLERHLAGEIQDLLHRQAIILLAYVSSGGSGFGTHKDPVGKACLDYAVVVVLDDRIGVRIDLRAGAGLFERDRRLDIEQMLCLGDGDADSLGVREFLGAAYVLGSKVLQNLQPQGGLAAHGSQGGCDGDSDHSGTGYAHSHPVLEDVGAHLHVYLEFGVAAPAVAAGIGTIFGDDFYSLGHGEGYGNWLGTAKGGLDFRVYEIYDLLLAICHISRNWTNPSMSRL